MKRVEAIANVVIIIAGTMVAGDLGMAWYHRFFPKPVPGPFKPGQRIADTTDLHLGAAPRTLLLMTASHCRYCKESLPFFQALTKTSHERHVAVVGVTAEEVGANEKYLRSNGVSVDRVVSATGNGIAIPGTPTLVLLQADGKVINSWRGKLPSNVEQEVVRAVQGDQP